VLIVTLCLSSQAWRFIGASAAACCLCGTATHPQLIALLAKHRGVHALNLTGLIGGLSRDVVLRVLPSLQQLRSLRYCSPQLLAPSGCTAAVAAAAAAAAAGSPATTTPSSPGIAGCITARTLSTLCSGLPALLSLELRGLFVQDAESPGGAILCHSSLTSLVLARCEAPALTLKCDTLRTLSLEGSSLPGLPCLVGCTALTQLRLPGCRRLHDPNLRAALPALTGLHALTLGGGMLLGDDTLREVSVGKSLAASSSCMGRACVCACARPLPPFTHACVRAPPHAQVHALVCVLPCQPAQITLPVRH
jgi:hypothetical protein